MAKLSNLFDERLKDSSNLVATAPQNLESLSPQVDEQELILKKIKQFETVKPKIDYSDFANFVFFNSALDYFNITGEKIINEYPYDGRVDELELFKDNLDGYQVHMLDIWPKRSGHLAFDPASGFSYVNVVDLGIDSGVSKTSMLSVGTGSISVEFWAIPPPALTGSEDVMVVLQKASGSSGYTTYFSGSNLFFRISSGSDIVEASATFAPGVNSYFSCVFDVEQSSPTLSVYTGSVSSFPVLVSSVGTGPSGTIELGHVSLTIASGSMSGKIVKSFTGSLDRVAVWNVPKTLAYMSSSFNTKLFAQSGLVAGWRFNESGSITVTPNDNDIVFDHSGHKINGRVINYSSAMRRSGSLVPYEDPDPILSIDAPEISNLVTTQQASSSLYDKLNDNIITRLMPQQFFQLEEIKGTDVLEKFLYVLAQQFDHIKTRIDQFVKVLRTDYGLYDQTPDALLSDVGKFFGWEFTGNFLNADAFQYMFGKNVLQDVESNSELETKLFEIKNEFWRRTLINMMHLYKTKGTRESVESLMRIYGVNKNFVKLKEFGLRQNSRINTNRIYAEKVVRAFACSSSGGFNGAYTPVFSSSFNSTEIRVMFPKSTSTSMVTTLQTGSIWTHVYTGSIGDYETAELSYAKSSLTSMTGSIKYSSTIDGGPSLFVLSISDLPIFDEKWYNIIVNRSNELSEISMHVISIDDGEIRSSFSASGSVPVSSSKHTVQSFVGTSAPLPSSEMWTQEFRVWERTLDEHEKLDHTLNFQSFGSTSVSGSDDLSCHYRLDGSYVGGTGMNFIDVSGKLSTMTASLGVAADPMRKFLIEYNYVASPEFGWNEDKVRIVESSEISSDDVFLENNAVSLEFNLIDALNEDMSQMVSSLEFLNSSIGSPANRYRQTYGDLRRLKDSYFKRLSGQLNFRVFSDLLEFFDRSFIDMIRRLIPASSVFLGDEFVVESHMFERPKLQWNYRRQDARSELEGTIKVFVRT